MIEPMGDDERAKLQKAIAELRRENAQLQAENTALRAEMEQVQEELQAAIERLKAIEGKRKRPPSFVKANRPKEEGQKRPRKKRSREHNTSRKRSKPTRIERHELERCGECGYLLRGGSVDYTREVIKLPRPQPVEVIEHQVIKRWCPSCEAWRRPKLDLRGQVFGQGRIGVEIGCLVAYLRTTLRLPVRQVKEYLQTMHQLELSVGEIAALTEQVERELGPQLEELRREVQGSAVVHVDETGWRENGQNGYVWAFVTEGAEAVRYFIRDGSRSHRVPQGVLGLRHRGYVVSDFYSAYNLLRGPHQRCWVHLLRALHELKEAEAERADVLEWAQAVREVYDEACVWVSEHPGATKKERLGKYRDLTRRIEALGQQYALVPDHPCRTLAKRLLRHLDELLPFVGVPGVPADNNPAERALRPVVIMRKISGGSRSAKGSRTRMALFSLFSTWAARGLNPYLRCLALLQHPVAHSPP